MCASSFHFNTTTILHILIIFQLFFCSFGYIDITITYSDVVFFSGTTNDNATGFVFVCAVVANIYVQLKYDSPYATHRFICGYCGGLRFANVVSSTGGINWPVNDRRKL